MRLVIAALAAFALLASSADAATRAVQAYDTPSFRTVWWPSTLAAQTGDTVQFRLTQPGNAFWKLRPKRKTLRARSGKRNTPSQMRATNSSD